MFFLGGGGQNIGKTKINNTQANCVIEICTVSIEAHRRYSPQHFFFFFFWIIQYGKAVNIGDVMVECFLFLFFRLQSSD